MSTQAGRYYIPDPSHWPIFGSIALLLMAFGATMWFNMVAAGPWLVAAGLGVLTYMLFGWFGTVIHESQAGRYNRQVDVSFRWGMSWFIFSEVMFFAAFFGALFYMRTLAVPGLGEGETALQLWPNFKPGWPVSGPGIESTFTPMGAWGIPAINTLILLSSGATVTWAHWGLKKGNRGQLTLGLLREGGFDDESGAKWFGAIADFLLGQAMLHCATVTLPAEIQDADKASWQTLSTRLPDDEYPHTQAAAPLLGEYMVQPSFELVLELTLKGLAASAPFGDGLALRTVER